MPPLIDLVAEDALIRCWEAGTLDVISTAIDVKTYLFINSSQLFLFIIRDFHTFIS